MKILQSFTVVWAKKEISLKLIYLLLGYEITISIVEAFKKVKKGNQYK